MFDYKHEYIFALGKALSTPCKLINRENLINSKCFDYKHEYIFALGKAYQHLVS